jgi:hypothetical protein
MPEAVAVFFVFAVIAFVFVVAWLRGRDVSLVNVSDDLQRLRQHEAWLRERLHRAELEQWDDAMIASLAADLRATSHQLDRAGR